MSEYKIRNSEDLSFKKASMEFKEGIKKLLNLDCNITGEVPKEIVTIENTEKNMDCVYSTDDNYLVHLEFQSTDINFEKDLRRFRFYNSATGNKYGKEVVTYIIYGSKIKRRDAILEERVSIFKPRTIFLNETFLEDELDKIKIKLESGENLSEYDNVILAISPALNHRSSLKPLIKEVIEITRKLPRRRDIDQLILLLSDKFLNSEEKKEIEEELRMCDLVRKFEEEAEERGYKEV